MPLDEVIERLHGCFDRGPSLYIHSNFFLEYLLVNVSMTTGSPVAAGAVGLVGVWTLRVTMAVRM
jgi:hypothetical protein